MYAIKFLLRGESPRAFVDLLHSLRWQPTVFVSDMPAHVALHGNKRKPSMFAPHAGRFMPATEEAIQFSKTEKFNISIPSLDATKWDLSAVHVDHPYSQGGVHPITKTADTFSAFDRFHQHNSKIPADRLRRPDTVLELQGRVNTQVMEELFSEIQRARFFLTQLSPIHHIFVVRLMLHLRNQQRTQKIMKRMEKTMTETIPGAEITIAEDKRVQITGDA